METALLFIQRVGLVPSGTASHMTVSNVRKAQLDKGRGDDGN